MFDRKIRFFTVRFLNRNGSKRMSDIVDLSPGMPGVVTARGKPVVG
jgi:hypothetical protein